MRKLLLLAFAVVFGAASVSAQQAQSDKKAATKIYIAFQWHMHQPVYWPGETVRQTDAARRYSYSVEDIHNQRIGPYTDWPKNAIATCINAGLGNCGAQVSFSGSLAQNLNSLKADGNHNFANWNSHYQWGKAQTTALGNPRLDMIGFGYHHPLMPLIDYKDIRRQIQMHRQSNASNFGGSYSKGMFPPENAFSERIIPALVDEGIEWVMVDNVHFDRAAEGYPFNTGGNLYEPNKADIVNPNPNDWVQLNGLWAPTKISAGWGHRPAWLEYIDPTTGSKKKIIAIPTSRYLGNEDGRGGFGALNYQAVMDQMQFANTDPNHPILVVLHHDGDNYGGGSSGYYGSNFTNFVNWVKSNPNYEATTVQDYLQRFPPDPSNVIHVEDGSWSGADNGDPEFLKWNWVDVTDSKKFTFDHNSWASIVAAQNILKTAEQVNPSHANLATAWSHLMTAQASCYWYWDGTEIWDSAATRGANLAVQVAQPIAQGGTDQTGPQVWTLQRQNYNPGGKEWTINKPADFEIWTFVYDLAGLGNVKLKVRVDDDGKNDLGTIVNDTYAGGAGVGAWQDLTMTCENYAPTPANMVQPLQRAKRCSAMVTGFNDKLLDYYVEAADANGNITKSDIYHVWVGTYTPSGGGGGGASTGVTFAPTSPTKDDVITVTISGATQGAKLHWGVNGWTAPNAVYHPAGTTAFNTQAVQTTMSGPTNGNLTVTLGPFNNAAQVVNEINFVIKYDNNTWDNNGGSDYKITVSGNSSNGGGQPTIVPFTMDGSLDTIAPTRATNNNVPLITGWNGRDLYVATKSAASLGKDVFILVSDTRDVLTTAPWGKGGQVGKYDFMIGNESTNNWAGWQNATGTNVTTNVGVNAGSQYLEGTLNLGAAFGATIPSPLYIAVAVYGTNNATPLDTQVPSGNADANVDGVEYYQYTFNPATGTLAEEVPTESKLYATYPNPFSDETNIMYRLKDDGNVRLEVYDMLGRMVQSVKDDYMESGYHQLKANFAHLASGTYMLRMHTADKTEMVKLLVVK